MPSLKYEGGSVELDKNGYLTNINAWNEAVAEAIAKREGITKLTEDRLEVIRFLRSYYMKFQLFPAARYGMHQRAPAKKLHVEAVQDGPAEGMEGGRAARSG